MSQMCQFNNLTQGKGLLEAGINPAYALSGRDPRGGGAMRYQGHSGGFAMRTKVCREEI